MHRSRVNGPDLMNQGAATYFTYLDHQRAFEAIGAWDTRQVSITGRGEPERVTALAASATTLPLLGVRPARGRLFTADEDAPGAPLRVVLTHGYWQRRFGAAADVVGQTLTVGDQAAVVVGVLPASFRFLRAAPAVVMPLRLDRAEAGEVSFGFQALGRLKPGVTLTQANADVARMIALLPPAFAMFELGPGVRPLADDVVGSLGEVLWVLLAAVGVVLLIACVNVANLLLIRAEGRQHEFALRAALGASRGRVARAVLAESGVLALAAGALAVLLAHGAVALLRRLAPAHLPRVDEIAVDPTVLLFTAGVAAAAGLLAGLVTVARFGAPSATALREGGRGASDGPRRQRTRDALVVSEVAMALVLLVVSGLMVRTFVALRQVDPGFVRPEAVQTFRVALAAPDTADDARVARTHQAIAERLAAVPGVASVGLSSHITMDGEDNTNPLYVEGVPVPAGGRWWSSPRRSRGSTGGSRRGRSASASAATRTPRGARSSASWATSATTGWTSRRRRSCTGRCSTTRTGRSRWRSPCARGAWATRASCATSSAPSGPSTRTRRSPPCARSTRSRPTRWRAPRSRWSCWPSPPGWRSSSASWGSTA
jgi:predicted permease